MRYVGLDVHKSTVRVCILDEGGKRVVGKTIPCSRESLVQFGQATLQPDDRLALEATTNTWAVVDLLRPFVASIIISNPLRTKAIAEAKVKTDKVDAEVLSQLLRCDYLPAVWAPDEKTRQLRQVMTYRAALISDRTRIKNRLKGILNQRLIKPPVKYLYSSAGMKWLQELSLSPQDRLLMDGQLRLLASLESELSSLDAKLQHHACDEERARLLMTLPGVGYGTALCLLASLGDINRFRDGDHAASYLGLVPSTKQSANHCYHGPITKTGSPTTRWMLTQGVQHIASHPGPLGVFFRRLCKRKNRNVAITAVARKVVTIAYLMLKNNEPYRYAVVDRTHKKFTSLRSSVQATSVKRKRRSAPTDLPSAYSLHGLPAVRRFDELPAGERRMLHERGLEPAIRVLHAQSSAVSAKNSG
jgi:transposase